MADNKRLDNIVCNVNYDGILIENNFATEQEMDKELKRNKDAAILFISSADGATPTCYQGYNLKQTIVIRDYLNDLIDLAETKLQ